jgi:alkaline phosphatase
MFKNNAKILIVLTLSILMFGCELQENYTLTKTSLELQSIQMREFDASYKTAFASTLSVFQDKGYVIVTADSATGFITVASPKNNKYNWFLGENKMDSTRATAFIEAMPSKKIAIRLNFVNYQEISSAYGSKSQNSVPIEDPKFYQGIFEKIQKAIFVRTNR